MWNAALRVQCIQPGPRAVTRGSKIDQGVLVEQSGIRHVGVVARESLSPVPEGLTRQMSKTLSEGIPRTKSMNASSGDHTGK